MTTRRTFLTTVAKVIAVAPVLPLLPSVASKVEKVVVHEMEGGSWAYCLWNGQDIDGILDFGNSGPAPLWGDDFKLEPTEHGWEVRFISISPVVSTARALPGDCIYRLPSGNFFVMHSSENFRRLFNYDVFEFEAWISKTDTMNTQNTDPLAVRWGGGVTRPPALLAYVS